jgi:hypothetical protein
MNRYAIIALVFVAAMGASYLKGRGDEKSRNVAATLAAERKADKDLAELGAFEEANRMMNRALEDQAYANVPTLDCGLPVSRVLRLNKR